MKPTPSSQELEIKRFNAERTKWDKRKIRWENWKKNKKR